MQNTKELSPIDHFMKNRVNNVVQMIREHNNSEEDKSERISQLKDSYALIEKEETKFFKFDHLKLNETLKSLNILNINNDPVCNICFNKQETEENRIVRCCICSETTHIACYEANPTKYPSSVPIMKWTCQRCAYLIKNPTESYYSTRCTLCPVYKGLTKPIEAFVWIHLLCKKWISEIQGLQKGQFKEPIFIDNVDSWRKRTVCSLCKLEEGAVVKCGMDRCQDCFHVTCLEKAKGIYSFNYHLMTCQEEYISFDFRTPIPPIYCQRHTLLSFKNLTCFSGDNKQSRKSQKQEIYLEKKPRKPRTAKEPHEVKGKRKVRIVDTQARILSKQTLDTQGNALTADNSEAKICKTEEKNKKTLTHMKMAIEKEGQFNIVINGDNTNEDSHEKKRHLCHMETIDLVDEENEDIDQNKTIKHTGVYCAHDGLCLYETICSDLTHMENGGETKMGLATMKRTKNIIMSIVEAYSNYDVEFKQLISN